VVAQNAPTDGTVHLYRVKWHSAAKGDAGALKSPDGGWFTVTVKETDSFSGGGAFESTPVMRKGRVFIGSRDGSPYCIGTEAAAPDQALRRSSHAAKASSPSPKATRPRPKRTWASP
jgi:hypothetical protein